MMAKDRGTNNNGSVPFRGFGVLVSCGGLEGLGAGLGFEGGVSVVKRRQRWERTLLVISVRRSSVTGCEPISWRGQRSDGNRHTKVLVDILPVLQGRESKSKQEKRRSLVILQ